MEISSQEDHEMPIPINSTYGGGHGHMIHHHHHDHAAPPTHNPQIPSNGNNGHGNYEHHHRDQEDNPHNHHHHQQQHVGGYNIISSKKQQGVKYKECLKNHAAAMGGNATDGCGEFMPSGEEGSIEALTCSACNCHRNFHRKEVEGEAIPFPAHYHHHHLQQPSQPRKLMLTHHKIRSAVPHQMIMPYMSTYMPPNSESDDQMEEDGGGVFPARPAPPYNNQKKRFRTKFTQEQKEKMLNFAERVGWKIQRQEESVVQQFCQEVGVKRRVLKVWMHNNKHNLAKKNSSDNNDNIVNNLNLSGGSNDNNPTGNLASNA
ncbi:PREDICTED: zinc-finger homeodomain protein 4 [Tarenaya hassleriana]|uniref:zinc-finger homeodomain protein 4 n=1 Tax=Tarenaya hassleriana TaxID=28532 RepID=UPI00053C643D|nr:PREDICTED: zinc-finger homeodomain protein 4 [Tarenaya hassleriana]